MSPYHELDFEVCDRVWLLTDDLQTDRPSHKLDHQQVGLYEILAKFDLPLSMGIYKVFQSSFLCKAADNLLPGQKVTPLLPVNITGDNE
jgi:hypothetical protein